MPLFQDCQNKKEVNQMQLSDFQVKLYVRDKFILK